MKIFYRALFFCASLLFFTATRAQILEFAENKGQWDKKVTYACDLGGMAFFLEKQGYKVFINDSADLRAIQDYYGGHSLRGRANSGADPYHAGQINAGKNNPGGARVLGLHSHAYEVIFPGSNPNPVIIPDKAIETYNNYYIGKDPSKWASHCRIFQAVTYKDVYPNIDVRYYTNNGTLKYDIIINPGGDISKVALRFDGTDGLATKNGNLIIKTSVGNVRELTPYAYQIDGKGRTTVDASYYISGNTVYFKTGNFSRSSVFVIDPTIMISTLTRSTADNWGYTATYDKDGYFYAGGIVFGNGFPTANGPSFQPNFAGGNNEGDKINGHDVAIIKLDPNGHNKIFATYLGGTGNEQPHSMIVDNNGSLIVAGRTLSQDFPVTMPTVGPGGNWDIFITKFTADGSALVASRKIGGTGDDGVNIAPKEEKVGAITIRRNYGDDARSEVITDDAGNIYLASCTQSKDNSPANPLVTANAFQRTFGGGTQDGMLIKTDPKLNIIFSSYLGGKGDDAAFVLALSPVNNDIFVGGATTSPDLKNADINTGVLHSSFQGGASDGYVTIISNDGSTQKRTVYVGTGGDDMLYGVQFDRAGYPYIMGTTTRPFPLTPNVAFNSQPKGKQFITKLGRDLSTIEYSTNFGKKTGSDTVPDISPVAFLVDRCENVYVSGWGGGIDPGEGYPNATTSGLTTFAKNPNDVFQKITDGKDFYFFVLEKNATSQLFGSFYGELPRKPGDNTLGDHVDGGTSRFDKNGIIYQAICANCGRTPEEDPGTGFPISSSLEWGTKNVSTMPSYCNEAAVKIAFELAGVSANLQSSINGIARDTSGCIPLTVDFTDTIHRAKQYMWNFGDGSPKVTTTTNQTSHTYTVVGTYTVTLVAVDSSACNIADTVFIHIRARDDYAALKISAAKLLPCDSLNYRFINSSVPPAGKPFSPQSLQWNFGDGTIINSNADTLYHRYTAAGTYEVSLHLNDTSYCNSPDADSIKLRIATMVKAQFNIPPGCAPYTAVINNTSIGGQQFFWNFGDGSTSTDPDPVHVFKAATTYTVSLFVVDSSTCNISDSTKVTISIAPQPTASFTVTPTPSQEDTPSDFANNSTGASKYQWDFGDGSGLTTFKLDTPVVHQYITSGTYKACLYASTIFGCIDTSCTAVEAIIRPLADVPNAFTPNGDGINDQVHVKGFGISKMDWKIYNRWGALVFESTSPDKGWDGYYNGVLQPQEVYTYVLNIIFSDNKRYQKKGDITLLR